MEFSMNSFWFFMYPCTALYSTEEDSLVPVETFGFVSIVWLVLKIINVLP